jgi:hypothetical protein
MRRCWLGKRAAGRQRRGALGAHYSPHPENVITRLLRSAAESVSGFALILAFGCVQIPAGPTSPVQAPTSLRATATVHWNDRARELVARHPSAPTVRVFAYLALAQRNAVVLARQSGYSIDGAVAGASASVLAYFIPDAASDIEAQLEREIAGMGANGQRGDFAAGVEIGRAIAVDVIATAKSDRSDLAWSGAAPNTPWTWKSQARPPQPPLYTNFIGMRTFFLATGSEFRSPPPPQLASEAFRKQVVDVRKISDTRTTEQLRIAQYWELVTGSFFPGWWNQTVLEAAEAHHLSQLETTEILALVHMAWFDAFIACADSKYTYWIPRPTQVDASIQLAIALPNHPSYPSNHSCTAAAAGGVLDAKFPDQGRRHSALAEEAAISRVYGGIHYPIDIEAGLEIGRKVATKVMAVGLPQDRVWFPSRL